MPQRNSGARIELKDLPAAYQAKVQSQLREQDKMLNERRERDQNERWDRVVRESHDVTEIFDGYVRMHGKDLPAFEREYQFAKAESGRAFRFDRASIPHRLGIECDGMTDESGGPGRHRRTKGFESDMAKTNQAAAMGWTVLRFTAAMLRADPIGCIETVRRALRARKWVG